MLELQVWIDGTKVERWLYADENGLWTANFATDPEFDILPGTSGQVKEYDANNNATQVGWRVPAPIIQASPNSWWVQGRDWPVGTEVTLTINDPGTPGPP